MIKYIFALTISILSAKIHYTERILTTALQNELGKRSNFNAKNYKTSSATLIAFFIILGFYYSNNRSYLLN